MNWLSQTSKHERTYGLGMDALVTACFCNTNGSMVWAWMLWSPYALATRTGLFDVLTARLPRLCTAVWPRMGFYPRRGRSLQESAPVLKVCQAKLGHSQRHFAVLGAQPRELRATFGLKNPRMAGLRSVSDTPVCAARRLVGGKTCSLRLALSMKLYASYLGLKVQTL